MDIFLGVVGVIIIVMLLVVIWLLVRKSQGTEKSTELKAMGERLIRVEGEIGKINPAIDRNFRENRKELNESLERMRMGNEKDLDRMRVSNEKSLEQLRTNNEQKLEQMRETVDEKLKASVEKRFNESFKSISTQLTLVFPGLGEMKTWGRGVGVLK